MTGLLIGFVVIVIVSIYLLRGFDRISGQGPKQVTDGINASGTKAPTPQQFPEEDIPQKIRDLDGLRGDGLISDDEYESKKTQLLKKIG